MTFRAVLIGVLSLFALILVWASLPFFTIDQTERGVITRWGAIARVADPGLGFKMPFVDTVNRVNVETHKQVLPHVQAYSRDQQPAELVVSFNYRVTDPVRVYSEFRNAANLVDRVVVPRVNELLKTVFGQFDAVTAIQDRAKLNIQVQDTIQKAIEGYPIAVEGVQIENIDFSDAYEQSIEQRMLAAVEVEKLRQNVLREEQTAKITVTQAKAKADATFAQAKADADSQRVRKEAEAEGIRLVGQATAEALRKKADALGSNPQLVEITKAERWNGQLPTMMTPESVLPMIDLSQSGVRPTAAAAAAPRQP